MISALEIERLDGIRVDPEVVLVTPGRRQIGKVARILSHFDAPGSGRRRRSASDLESQLIAGRVGIDVH